MLALCFALACARPVVPLAPDAARVDAASVDSARATDASTDAEPADTRFDAGECGLFDPDRDLIDSADEGRGDPDGDGMPSERDIDSVGDGALDLEEAGDALCATPPVSCDQEVVDDHRFDALDADSDGDGLGDGDESLTGRCDVDSDHDGVTDLIEHAFAAWSCRVRHYDCDCAMEASCTPSPDAIIHVLDPEGDGSQHTVTFGLPSSLPGAIDVEALVRDAFVGDSGIDPRTLVASVRPACMGGATDCWTEPAGVSHDAAVASVTATQFLGVVPGTELDFTVTLTSDALPTGPRSLVAAVEIDLVEVGSGVPIDQQYVVLVIAAE